MKDSLIQRAIKKTTEVRRKLKLSPRYPIDIYDVCEKLGLTVQFLALSGLEGMYVNEQKEQRIIISSLRPIGRQVFTCGHELGHHMFGHGMKFDEINSISSGNKFDQDEFLVDCFSGLLLMPKIAVCKAFSSRSWTLSEVTPLELYTVACSFGVGYGTLLTHLTQALQLVSREQYKELNRYSPRTIRAALDGVENSEPLTIVDEHWFSKKSVDVDIGHQVLLPAGVMVEGCPSSYLLKRIELGSLLTSTKSGLLRVYHPTTDWAVFVKASQAQYVGFSKYRYL